MYGENSFYRDYENLLIKNDELSKENRKLKYIQKLLENQIQTLMKKRSTSQSRNRREGKSVKRKGIWDC